MLLFLYFYQSTPEMAHANPPISYLLPLPLPPRHSRLIRWQRRRSPSPSTRFSGFSFEAFEHRFRSQALMPCSHWTTCPSALVSIAISGTRTCTGRSPFSARRRPALNIPAHHYWLSAKNVPHDKESPWGHGCRPSNWFFITHPGS
jgi:hypothetical protein